MFNVAANPNESFINSVARDTALESCHDYELPATNLIFYLLRRDHTFMYFTLGNKAKDLKISELFLKEKESEIHIRKIFKIIFISYQKEDNIFLNVLKT